MAKARVSTNPMYTGGAGGYSFYVRGGEQVVRQRRNNSNYGESASRTEAQMLRRVKWGNLVNVYKSMASWQPKAYEFKAAGQTDYNIFMSMNINSAMCALTKDMANNGCAVQEGFWVSRGSLPPVERAVTDPSGGIGTNITMTITPSASTTVGQLSADIINNNPLYQDGDNLAFILFTNFIDNRGYPYLSTRYSELTLNPSSTELLQSIPLLDRIIPGDNNDLAFRCGAALSSESGLVIIHTRRESGILKVSSQSIWGTGETLIDQFSGQSWIQSCIASYGIDSRVPLDPGEGGGGTSDINVLASSVTVNMYGGVGSGEVVTGTGLLYVAPDLRGRILSITANPDHRCDVSFCDSTSPAIGDTLISSFSVEAGRTERKVVPASALSILIRAGVVEGNTDYAPTAATINQ